MTREKSNRVAEASQAAKEEPPQENATHILMQFSSRNQEDLYRADGMLVASRQGDLVRFGHDVGTAQSRLFMNERMAAAWLRKLAGVDIVAQTKGVALHDVVYGPDHFTQAVIEERQAESLLALPGTGKVMHN